MKKLHTLLTASALAASVVSFADTGTGNLTLPHSGPLLIPLPNTGAAAISGPNTVVSSSVAVDTGSGSDDFSVENRNRHHWFALFGVLFPSYSSNSVSVGPGFDFAVGYRYNLDFGDIRISSRGQGYATTYSGTDSGGNSISSDNVVTMDVLSVEAFYRSGQLYGGPGFGIGTASYLTAQTGPGGVSETTSSESISLFSLAVGYDFNTATFVEARWQTASDSQFNGYSLSIGFRF